MSDDDKKQIKTSTVYVTASAADPPPADGGDVRFLVGKPSPTGGKWGSFVFYGAEEKEVMRIDPDGSFWVEGRRVEQDQLVYEGFKLWLGAAVGRMGEG